MQKTKTQKSEVLRYMQSHKGITSLQAIEKFGATRLSDISLKLRQEGYAIKTESITKKNRYGHTTTFARYTLV